MNLSVSFKSQASQHGFSIIEIIVAVVVLGVGLLAVASFQGSLMVQSQTSKARAEATAHAQARIEQMRNYTNAVADVAEFDTLFANTGGFANNTAITGQNAVFTRSESVVVDGNMKVLAVQVVWTGSDGAQEQVTLNTQLSWQAPRSTADIARSSSDLLKSPTGRAVLGDGYVPEGESTTGNGDGTSLYDAGDGDLRLAVDNVVVLTLLDACLSAGTCIDFAQISGTVWIDTAEKTINPGEVFVKASDAAFCQRYWIDAFGAVQTVENTALSAATTASGDYDYFHYTCYVGGGWHGNIGLVLAAGLNQKDRVCQGDPTAVNTYQQPVIAARRAYRGMLFKHDSATTSLKEEYTDPNGNALTRYYSTGIADSLHLPAEGQAGHDFVLSRLPVSQTEDERCTTASIMLRPDSNDQGTSGDLFAGVPTDFVCLNGNNGNQLDYFDTNVYGSENTCPYDPTDPPTAAHFLTGVISVDGESGYIDEMNNFFLTTSDGPGNCGIDPFIYDSATGVYSGQISCVVFDWGSGWDGTIQLFVNSGLISCPVTELVYAGLSNNVTTADFPCSLNLGGPVESYDYSVSGNFALPGGHSITSVAMTGGTCTFSNASYLCETTTTSSEFSGQIDFDSNKGYFCTYGMDNPTGIKTYTGLTPGAATFDVTMIRKNTCTY